MKNRFYNHISIIYINDYRILLTFNEKVVLFSNGIKLQHDLVQVTNCPTQKGQHP